VWQAIEGHDDVVQAMRQAWERGRLGHAYLLVGPSGVGKRMFARALAQTLLCEGRPGEAFDPCGDCPACAQVRAGSHPDLIQQGRDADSAEFKIAAMRQVIRDLGFKPDRGRHKIAIIDDADDLNEESANCFLKSLEEPPPRSLLMLVGTSPDRQLATIRSRCQILRFGPLDAAVVARLLVQDGAVNDPAEAGRVAAISNGSLERARALADPDLAQFRTFLWNSLAATRPDMIALADAMNVLIEGAGKENAQKRLRARLLMESATDFLHSCLRVSVGAATPTASAGARDAIAQFSARRSPEAIAQQIERCLVADYQVDRNASLPLVIESWADDVTKPA
jgi:DNA polymerase-3 subunit delta'